MSEWQPIETAPTLDQGSFLLVACYGKHSVEAYLSVDGQWKFFSWNGPEVMKPQPDLWMPRPIAPEREG